jgi:hypothetical protein
LRKEVDRAFARPERCYPIRAIARRSQGLRLRGLVYGSSEAELIASIRVREMLAAMASVAGRPAPDGICAGRPVPQTELRIIRACDDPLELESERLAQWEVARGEVGEVQVSGAHVLGGYWNDPEAERRNKIREGDRVWHRTGDGGWLDAEGRALADGPREAARRSRRTRVVERAGRAARVRAAGREPCRVFWSARSLARATCGAVRRDDRPSTAPDIERVRAARDPIPVDELRAVRHMARDPRSLLPSTIHAWLGSCSACVGWQRTHRRMQTLCILTRLFWLSRTK